LLCWACLICCCLLLLPGLHHSVEHWKKPFNPILGETWQATMPGGLQLFMEQVRTSADDSMCCSKLGSCGRRVHADSCSAVQQQVQHRPWYNKAWYHLSFALVVQLGT
jgi:hypothetical protein